MPEIGEIKSGRGTGYKNKFVLVACIDCGKERWVQLVKGKPVSLRCRSCASKLRPHLSGSVAHNWKGGHNKTEDGYILIKLSLGNFFYPMVRKNGYVLEHRFVMAQHLGRCLQPWEIVHHKGVRYTGKENKADNLKDNLALSPSLGEHSTNHSKGYQDGYNKGYADGLKKAT